MALRGNWQRVIRKLRNFQQDLENTLRQTTLQAAELVESTAIGHLKNQDLGWQSLSEPYKRYKLRAKKKGSRRLSEKILIATGTYFQSITSYVDELHVFVGVMRGVAREADGTDVVNIAMVHEDPQTSPVPKRPLWKPTFEETKPQIIRMFHATLKEVLNR